MDADLRLVAEAAAGSAEAFDELVRRHQRPIFNLVRALTGDEADADDLAQEVFVRAFRSLGRFRGESSFRTWLHAVALNVVRTHRERRGRQRQLLAPAPAGGLESVPGAIPPADQGVEARLILREAIDAALASLPEPLRVAVTLRDVQGLEYREIAGVLKIPMGTVESRIFRARQLLRPLLEPLLGGRPTGKR